MSACEIHNCMDGGHCGRAYYCSQSFNPPWERILHLYHCHVTSCREKNIAQFHSQWVWPYDFFWPMEQKRNDMCNLWRGVLRIFECSWPLLLFFLCHENRGYWRYQESQNETVQGTESQLKQTYIWHVHNKYTFAISMHWNDEVISLHSLT